MCAKAKKAKNLCANTGKLASPIAVAQIVKSYNTNGEVVVKLTSDLLEDLNRKEPVFIYFDELPVPFFITRFTTKGNSGAIVKFSTVNDMAHSEELVKRTIFIESSSADAEALESFAQENFEAYITGFALFNEDDRFIGEITAYYNYPNNPCIEVELAEGICSALSENASAEHESILIPFQESFITAFDAENREIQMTIPVGLISIDQE